MSCKKGSKHSEETKAKMSLARMGNKYCVGRIPWNKGTKGVMVAWNKGKKLSEEHKEKLSEAKQVFYANGGKPPNYLKDRSLVKLGDRKLHDPLVKEWRMEVKKRDNFSCRIADNNCDGRLEVHHILRWSEFPELRYQINNGITLCHAHHPHARAEEKRLIATFTELVSMPVSKK